MQEGWIPFSPFSIPCGEVDIETRYADQSSGFIRIYGKKDKFIVNHDERLLIEKPISYRYRKPPKIVEVDDVEIPKNIQEGFAQLLDELTERVKQKNKDHNEILETCRKAAPIQ